MKYTINSQGVVLGSKTDRDYFESVDNSIVKKIQNAKELKK